MEKVASLQLGCFYLLTNLEKARAQLQCQSFARTENFTSQLFPFLTPSHQT